MTRVDSLEKDLKQTKLTMGSAIVKLVKKVKKLEGLVTPSKTTVNASWEEQVEDISPTTLEAAKTLSRVASQKPKSIDKGRKYCVLTSPFLSLYKGHSEGQGSLMIIEEAPKKTKEQILQEEASLAEAIRLDNLEKEEEVKQVHLDSLLAQRISEEEELNEQQKKRRAQVQFEAQHYTDEDWDLIRARLS
ncbi:hypothetical protein Tco_1045058 [Tanacetum coccineum]|uniref:Uncharacterized protein n=1 Tax=Tanacetum coccineum TaxID=301880 RepID=A0ABQ5GS75_9ASTR